MSNTSDTPPPAKRINTAYSAVQGQLLPPLDTSDLFAGTTVSVTVKASPDSEESQTFPVNRALLCGHSKYFAGAFQSGFVEAEKKMIELDDVEPWVFRCFLGWVYTRTICYHPAGVGGPPLSEIFERPVTLIDNNHENNPQDPIAWNWTGLVTLYIFADQYDCRLLRNAVLQSIQVKALQSHPRRYQRPNAKTIDYMHKNLGKSNNLYRFLKELWAESLAEMDMSQEMEGQITEELELLPQSFLVECFVKVHRKRAALSCQDCGGRRDYGDCETTGHDIEDREALEDECPCFYHEHEGWTEKEACAETYHSRTLRQRVFGPREVEGESDGEVDEMN